MRFPRLPLGLLILGASLGGCSQTGPLRTAESGDVRTTATIGDKPVSIVGGIPDDGAVARANVGAGAPSSRSLEGRISGRVYDEQNEPVANARVRLAVGGEPGGKAIFATTDRSGAFTLRGLRPGSNYTLIAEYQGDQGMMSGRVDADAPEANVRIGLHLRDAGTGGDDRTLAANPGKPNLRAISRAEEVDEEDFFEEAPPARGDRERLNREDVAPSSDIGFDDFQDEERETPSLRSSRRPRAESRYSDEFQDDWDDEENPLPPARELGGVDQRGRRESEPNVGSRVRVARAADDELPPAAEPDDAARTVRSEAFAPILIDEPEPYSNRIETTTPAQPKPRAARDRSDEPTKREAPSTESRRPTWGEVVSQHQEIPVDESLMKAANAPVAAPDPESPSPAVAEVVEAPAPAPVELEKDDDRGPLLQRKPGPYCEYDPGERKVVDLALPDVSGRMVSIRDFDADLILLDFWGTWCAPCRKSIPHLKELQASLGGKKLQVLGIACERTSAEERAAKVAEVVKETGINYAVLVTGMDGSCPVQEALAIQFYPTMILLDREGKILLREQGATDATLARMDRFIAKNLDRDQPAFAAEDGDGPAGR